ncbi:MAG: hypothetical protein QOD72_2211 [Acidimicrobiaceae bacterium]|nr:hypothetical protein [Acidimicrobiaceae bacterium]
MNDRQLTERIAALAPVRDEDIANGLRGAAEDLLIGITMSPSVESEGTAVRARPTRPRRARVVVIAVAAALAVGATAAAADHLVHAHTGWFGRGGTSEEGPGEFIRLGAPDVASVVDRIGAQIALPPGSDFEQWKAHNLRPAVNGGAEMTTSGIRSSLEMDAACAWTGYWLDGYDRGDEAQKSSALRVLEQIPTWPALVASDGGGLVASLEQRAEGARTDRPELFMQDYQVNCTGELPMTNGPQPR